MKYERRVTVRRKAKDLYAYWRDFRNLPEFMDILVAVEDLGQDRWKWTISGPLDVHLSWESEIINEHPDELIAWKTIGTPDIASSGSVRFTPVNGGEETEVKLTVEYDPPGGFVGSALAALLMDSPEDRLDQDLMRFKEIMESDTVT